MTKLEHRFMDDVLAKMLFVQHPHLLKRFVARVLELQLKLLDTSG